MCDEREHSQSSAAFLAEILGELKSQAWTDIELAEIERDLVDRMNKIEWLPDHFEWQQFLAYLIGRQGTHLLDFKAFYRERADLERKAFGPDAPRP